MTYLHQDTPRLWVGPPGVGKTAYVESLYDYTEVVLLSSRNEEDIAGLPWRDGERDRRTQADLFANLEEADRKGLSTCLFLDEIDKARREVADTLLTLLTARKVGAWSLPERCHIAAAANPPEWGGGSGISEAMQTRFSVRPFKLNPARWREWVTKAYPGELSQAVGDAVVHGKVPLFERTGDGYDLRVTCPRTWEMALIAATRSSEEDREPDIRGVLTVNAANFLLQKLHMLPLPEAALATASRQVAAQAARSVRKPVNPIRI